MQYDFGVFGNDRRQVFVGQLLQKAGYRVLYHEISSEKYSPKEEAVQMSTASSFFELLSQTEILLGPIPLSKALDKDAQGQLEKALQQGKTLIAGCIPKRFQKEEYKQYDYMEDASLTIFNSIATAEGAIIRAVESSIGNLSGSNSLVIGYGVCGKTLASRLQGMKSAVSVCARRECIRTEAETEGCQSFSFAELSENIGRMDYIFNTVPAPVLGKSELCSLKEHAVIIDIASAPGGVDYQVAEKLNVCAKLCPGLPGIYAPLASAEAMVQFIDSKTKGE